MTSNISRQLVCLHFGKKIGIRAHGFWQDFIRILVRISGSRLRRNATQCDCSVHVAAEIHSIFFDWVVFMLKSHLVLTEVFW